MISINPYINFPGTCEEAFKHYQSVFGGEFAHLARFKEMPENPDFPLAEEDKEKIMHISLQIGDIVLMGSDVSENFGPPYQNGNNYSISINLEGKEKAQELFENLSEGGQVLMPFEETFWKAYFGMFVDRFGIQWMVNSVIEE